MRIVTLDGQHWRTPLDFHQSLFVGIEQGHPHGLSVDAFVDSMVWRGMGGLEPPYRVVIINIAGAPQDVKDEVSLLASTVAEARRERFICQGVDVEVSIACVEL